MDIETTTPATDIVAVDEEQGFTSSDLTKIALTAAATAVVLIGGKKVLVRTIVKLGAFAEKHAAKNAEVVVIETPTETTTTEAA